MDAKSGISTVFAAIKRDGTLFYKAGSYPLNLTNISNFQDEILMNKTFGGYFLNWHHGPMCAISQTLSGDSKR